MKLVIQIIMGVTQLRGNGPVASSSNSKYLSFVYHIVSAVIIVNSDGFRLIYTCDSVCVVYESGSALSFRMLNFFIVTYRARLYPCGIQPLVSTYYFNRHWGVFWVRSDLESRKNFIFRGECSGTKSQNRGVLENFGQKFLEA